MAKKTTSVGRNAVCALVLVLAARTGVRAQQAPFEFGLGWAGVFPHAASSYAGGVTVQPTDSGAYLVSFRWRFRPHHSLEFAFGRTRDSETFLINGNRFRLDTNASQWSGSYVLHPFPAAKLQPFLLAGAGAVRFSVGNTYVNGFQSDLGASGQTALAVSYGVGADYPLWRALALRLEYRGFLFRQPNFGLEQFATGSRTHLAEPAAGLVVRF